VGKRGPKPKSAELESAQGFPGRRKKKTKAVLEEKTPPDDIQDEARDSAFVPPAPGYLTKTARRIWGELFSDPSTRLWFKNSDHRILARYCSLMAVHETTMRRPPQPTYEIVKETPGGDDAPPTKSVAIKRNPAYDQMLATMRELRAIEQLIGASPAGRLGLESKLGAGSGKDKPSTPQSTAQGTGQRPAGPLGALNPQTQRSNMN
jgi:P27 family predicted phage terminase small subunit